MSGYAHDCLTVSCDRLDLRRAVGQNEVRPSDRPRTNVTGYLRFKHQGRDKSDSGQSGATLRGSPFLYDWGEISNSLEALPKKETTTHIIKHQHVLTSRRRTGNQALRRICMFDPKGGTDSARAQPCTIWRFAVRNATDRFGGQR